MNGSKRINSLRVSPIRKLMPYAKKCEENGIKVIKMNIGQPDIKTPKVFFDAMCDFDFEVLEYMDSRGIEELINAFIDYYKNFDIEFEYDDIIITQGASEAITFIFMAVCDLEDEILVPEPFYANYGNFADIVAVNLVPIATKAEENFSLPSIDVMQEKINQKTKAIMISNPCNPTGRVYTESELKTVVEIAEKNDLFIISDEVYKEFVYDDHRFISMASFKNIEQRIIILDSISKRFSCCGARVGTVATKNKMLIDNMMKLAQARLSVATLEQFGAAALQRVDPNYIKNTLDIYKNRRDIILEGLSKIDDVIYNTPEGAFYTIVKLPVDDAEKFVIWTLENIQIEGATLLITPANGFYSNDTDGIDEVRISYCIDDTDIKLGMEILKRALEEYPGRKA